MAWLYLLLAGFAEVFWATFLKLSDGFSKPVFSVVTVVGMIVSFLLLAQATKSLPLGTAYGIWTGIGALGAVAVGIIVFKEPVTAMRIIFAAVLLVGIIGLKISSPG